MLQLFGIIWDTWWHALLNLLVGINSVVNYPGISIIIFTLIIRLFTVPLTLKSMRSARNMQQIQPLIKEVQKKYAKDRAKQQEETMKIYHEYGVNPAAGCFPALVQIPVFIGLYTALRFILDHGSARSFVHLARIVGVLPVSAEQDVHTDPRSEPAGGLADGDDAEHDAVHADHLPVHLDQLPGGHGYL